MIIILIQILFFHYKNNLFIFRNQKNTLIKNKTEIFENKIKRLKASHLEDLKERDEKIAVIFAFMLFFIFNIFFFFSESCFKFK